MKNFMKRIFPGLLVVILPGGTPTFFASAQEQKTEKHFLGWEAEPLVGTISAERPGFSTSPLTLPRGRIGVEGGYQFTSDKGNDGHTLPLLLLRAGLPHNLELQIGWAGLSWDQADGGFEQDPNDMTVALKMNLTRQDRFVPTLGLLGSLSLPTGSGNATSNGVDPTAGFLWNYDLEDGPGLFGTVLLSSISGDGGRFFQAANAVGMGLSLTDSVGTFIEYFGFYSDGGSPSHNIDGGLTYLVTDNLQLDVNGGVGLNSAADDFFVGTGVAFRF